QPMRLPHTLDIQRRTSPSCSAQREREAASSHPRPSAMPLVRRFAPARPGHAYWYPGARNKLYSYLMTPESAHSPGPVLLLRTRDAERSLPAGRSYFIGRDPQSDIVVNDSRVSWRHAVLRQDGSTWLLEDVGSTNGTFQGRDRVQRVTISGSC